MLLAPYALIIFILDNQGGYIRNFLTRFKAWIIPILVAVLIAINVVVLTQFSDASQKLVEQQSTVVETRQQLENSESQFKKLEAKNVEVTESLNKEKAEADKLNEENQTLKANLQAKKDAEEAAIATMYAGVSAKESFSSSSAGNSYAPGYCTWYVKNRRPDIGNFWGNANQWLASAQSSGFSTGATPQPGAVAVSLSETHVAYVESVVGGSVTISEMNYGGLYNMNTRTVPASMFAYIY